MANKIMSEVDGEGEGFSTSNEGSRKGIWVEKNLKTHLSPLYYARLAPPHTA